MKKVELYITSPNRIMINYDWLTEMNYLPTPDSNAKITCWRTHNITHLTNIFFFFLNNLSKNVAFMQIYMKK